MSSKPATATPAVRPADRFAVRCELLRLSTQPSGPVLLVQFALDCGVAALFAWQYSLTRALMWIALIAVTTAWRGFFPQRLPAMLTVDNLPSALREHTLRIAIHEGAHGAAGVLLFNPGQPLAQLLLALVILGMTLSSAFSVSYHPRTMQLAMTLLLAPMIVMALAFGAPSMVAVAVLGIGLLAMVWKLVAERSRQLEDNIGLRHNESSLREQALAGLHAAEQAQSERLRFFSAANHDLRQPVMAIGLQVEVLRQQLREPAPVTAEVQRTVQSLAQAQHALASLTNQLLEISRIEAAADPLLRDAVALAPLLHDVAHQYGAGRVRVLCGPEATGLGDALALRRMVGNLTDNAVKFTPHGRVLLACRRRADGWRIEVRDGGVGIPADAQARVFDDFEQVGNTERNLQRGHGLGLAIVRRLAERLELRITLRSAPGRGSVFGFTLPATAPRSRPLADAAATPDDSAAPRPGLAVLVVEDNAVVADSLAALLRRWQAVPRIYGSAAEALALADLETIDAALCDIRLPGEMDGITLADRLWRLRPALPIALVSADIDPPTWALARERGWFALQKPVQPAQLRAVLVAATLPLAA